MKKVLFLVLFLPPVLALFAQRTITGKATDQNGVPVANASITIKGSSKGTVSNAIGVLMWIRKQGHLFFPIPEWLLWKSR
jgi:hypothetical protein